MSIKILTGFQRPFAVQTNLRGQLFVANFNPPNVGIFTFEGEPLGWLTGSKPSNTLPVTAESIFKGPHSIVLDEEENIYINDYYARRVLQFSKEGEFQKVVVSFETVSHPWHMKGPAMAHFDPDGNFIVSDCGSHSLQKYSREGKFLGWLGFFSDEKQTEGWRIEGEPTESTEVGGFDRVHSVAWDTQKNMYVVDTWNHRIQKFDERGMVLGWIGMNEKGDIGFHQSGKSVQTAQPGGFHAPVSLDLQGNVFVVCEYGNSRVQKFSIHGEFLKCYGSQGSSPGMFHHPYDVKVKDSKIIVADSDNHRIQIFNLDE